MKQRMILSDLQFEHLQELLVYAHDVLLYEMEDLIRQLRHLVNSHQLESTTIVRISRNFIDKKLMLDNVIDLLREICGENNMPVSGK